MLAILLGYGGATAAPRSVARRCAARGGPRRQGLARLCLLAPGGRAPLGGKNLLGPCLGLSRLLKALGPAQGANHLAGALLGALAAAWGPGI